MLRLWYVSTRYQYHFTQNSRFISKFWGALQKSMWTKVNFSVTFHPQTEDQSERTLHILEDLLRAYALDMQTSWDKHLHSVEFSYNNNYHSRILMAPSEAPYGRKCRSHVYWEEVGESVQLVLTCSRGLQILWNR